MLSHQDILRRLIKIQERRKELVADIDRDEMVMEYLAGKRNTIDLTIDLKPDKSLGKSARSAAEPNVRNHAEYLKYVREHCDLHFFENIRDDLKRIPDSNGSRFFEKKNIKIGIVADQFLYNSFKGIADFFYITPENYREFTGELDVFLVATAWRGLNQEWMGLGNANQWDVRRMLYKIIDYYRNQGTPIVFYSKEDPPNYDVFVDIAKQCDFVLTTEKSKVDDYRKDCGHDRIAVMRFGVNPLYHNPIGMRNPFKREEVLFAGSWYRKYPERQLDTRMIFDGVIESGRRLKIIDRNFGVEKSSNYEFPLKYAQYISPAISHEDLQKVHKLFDWAINLNSIKHTETMFANRVYELQALGNLVMSNYNTAVNNLFPNVFLIHSKEEVVHLLNSMDEEDVYRHQVLGIRKVMSGETTFHRIEDMLRFLGMNAETKTRRIAVLAEQKTDAVLQAFERQTYPDKDLILCSEWSEALKERYDMVAFFHPNHEYEEFYLEDMINGFKYTSCDYVTKDGYYSGTQYNKGIEHNYVSQIRSKYRTVFWANAFNIRDLIASEAPISLDNGYSIDPFEYNECPMERIRVSSPSPVLSVIVPVFNNGEKLLGKCFSSLKRSSIFDRMEILLIDDGSTDGMTPKIVNRLERHYPNVKAYYYPPGGSGSASRPRNKGLELATAEHVTFLDPDNEAIHDGYAKLMEELSRQDVDMVVGNIIKVDNKRSIFDFYKRTISTIHNDLITDTKRFLIDASLINGHSIQALVVKKNIIDKYNLRMVEKASEQDALFFHQILLHCSKVKAVDALIHVNYAAVEGCVTNTVKT